MGKWRDLFESRTYSEDEGERRGHYAFNSPASPDQIERVEAGLGFQLPSDLRDLLSEFNGIRWVIPEYEIDLYFSTEKMLTDVSEYIRQWEDDALNELAKHVAFVCHENGMADLYGVVVRDVAGFRAGEVVMVDHELIGFGEEYCEKRFESLMDLVRDGPRDP